MTGFPLHAAGRSLALAAALLILPGVAAHGHSYKFGEVSVGHVWAPPPDPRADGIPVYGPILNRGDKPVHLAGASTPAANKVRIRVEKAGDVQWPAGIELRPMRPVALAAWRAHLWVSGLKRDLKQGDSFELTLDFGEAGRHTVEVIVESGSAH